MNAAKNESNVTRVLLTAEGPAAEHFRRALERLGVPTALLTDDPTDRANWEARGIPTIFCPPAKAADFALPEFPVRAVYLFEDTLRHTCSYLQFAVDRLCAPVYVITRNGTSSRLYKQWGASYVVCTHSDDVSFLLPPSECSPIHPF